MTATIALVGDPVGASVSPAMQNAAFRAAGLPLEYVAVRVPRGELPAAFPQLRARYVGLNVTIPHKEAMLACVDALTRDARAARSVNTVTFRAGRAIGGSTDGAGFLRALRRAHQERRVNSAMILGTGGAARAVAAALAGEGVRVSVSGRDAAAGARLAADVAGTTFVERGSLAEAVRDADLVVSAVPLEAWSGVRPPLPEEASLRGSVVAFDLVYRPRRTPFLARAARAGCATIEGIEMLIEQGALSFEAWTGHAAPVEVMREAAYAALTEAASSVPA
jgi:shikimate dehydrogenase